MGTGPGSVTRAQAVKRAPSTRPWARTTAMTVYAALFVLWSELLGIPNDTLQVFAWLWLGTVAWHVEAQPRYHLNFLQDWWPPVRRPDRLLLQPRPHRQPRAAGALLRCRSTSTTWLGGGSTPTDGCRRPGAATRACGTSEPRWYDVVLHHRLRVALPGRADHRRRAVGAQPGRVGHAGCAATSPSTSAPWRSTSLYPMAPPWMAVRAGLPRRRRPPDHRPRLARPRPGPARPDPAQGVGNPVAAMPSLHAGIDRS